MIVTTPQGRRRSDLAAAEDVAVLQERLAALAPEAQAAALALIGDAGADPGTLGLLDALQAANYRWAPVGIAEFVDDPYYLGEACATLYPALRADLIALFGAPHDQALLGGSIGYGKTMFGSVAMAYILYQLSCMVSPQRVFGLSPGSEIVLIAVSRNLDLARNVMKTAIDDKIKLSPYFQQHFPPDFRVDSTGFPNNVRLIIGSYGAERSLGNNIIASWMDETNFPPKRHAQQIQQGLGRRTTAAHYDVAEKVYRSYLRRIKSRFANMGGALSGMVIMTSSATTLESFTERKMREAREDPHVFVREHTNWTTKPVGAFCGEVFWVLCSRASTQARILRDDEVAAYLQSPPPDAWVMDIPVEFRDDFETNMEEALRDIAGVATQAIAAFLQRLDALERCWDPARAHPFSVGEWTAGGPGGWRWEQLCQRVQRRLRGGGAEEGWLPQVRPAAPRWIHVDTSLSGDATGLAMVHVAEWIEVRRRSPEGVHYVEAAPQIEVDAVLRINPPPGEQIYLPDVRRLIYELRDHGFRICGVSTDTYQAAETHQQLRRRGFHTEVLSVDTSMAPYEELKAAIYEGRLRGYAYPALIEELKQLEYDRVRGKIDHPRHASKDTSDALAGAVFGISKLAGQLPVVPDGGTPEEAPHGIDVARGMVPVAQARLVTDGDALGAEPATDQVGRRPLLILG